MTDIESTPRTTTDSGIPVDSADSRRDRVGRWLACDSVAGELLVVGPGEVVPVGGRVEDAVAVLNESAFAGDPLQVERAVGEPVRSGVVNAATAFEVRATATADAITYAGIVRLAQQAGADSAPIIRLADRYAARRSVTRTDTQCSDVQAPRAGTTGTTRQAMMTWWAPGYGQRLFIPDPTRNRPLPHKRAERAPPRVSECSLKHAIFSRHQLQPRKI